MSEVDATTGAAVQLLTSGTVVQVFLLAGSLPAGALDDVAVGAGAVAGGQLGVGESDWTPYSLLGDGLDAGDQRA